MKIFKRKPCKLCRKSFAIMRGDEPIPNDEKERQKMLSHSCRTSRVILKTLNFGMDGDKLKGVDWAEIAEAWNK